MKMTDDELIYAASEAMAQVEEYRLQILERYRGKVVKAYGEKLFQVERADIADGGIQLRGSLLKKDGSPHARNEYGVPVGDAEFVA